ncbi:profilin crystallized from sodium formate [Aspergillus pseudonomiae]|uniref:Profilin n=1 Tax=Aspergillus pseudonomiae TaxID=1506151 RepID=A0A5N6HXH4_9EURO|nr:profilin [Aspergillus pseudonomiae]KAB8258130.1 profilin crystallized from sodium formate [Aspergillus pseudonomiae]KAE8403911.1 profilin [Aspergillus pseudonomiae]
MSWQSYVDTSLVGSGHIDKAAIFSGGGDNIWASTPGFSVTPAEIQSLITGFSDASSLHSNGVDLAGEKYQVVTANANTISGKKGTEGVYACKTNQVVVVAHSPDGVVHEQAARVVQALGEYLNGLGY